MTDQEIKELVAGLAIKSDRLDAQQAETNAQMKRTDEKLERIGITLGNISNNQGSVAEEFFYNSLAHTQTLAGIHYDIVYKNMTASANKIQDEYDIVMVNGKDIAIIEVKYKAHESDLDKLLTKKYENFKKLFPMYKDYNHHLVLATFSLYDDLKEMALANGVTVLQRKGDTIESFVPAA
ncbi:MAG: hypothetical protein WCW84_11110 [Sulfurimonas sp.]